MALSIKDPEADRLARALAARTGETLTETVLTALRERLVREEGKAGTVSLRLELESLRKRCASLPVLDDRHPDDLVGYDDDGLPT